MFEGVGAGLRFGPFLVVAGSVEGFSREHQSTLGLYQRTLRSLSWSGFEGRAVTEEYQKAFRFARTAGLHPQVKGKTHVRIHRFEQVDTLNHYGFHAFPNCGFSPGTHRAHAR